ncbi:MAG TPA: FAD:protein FMN transferase [Chitinophagaceae bacterium]|nr:FAD:protein FMN transferase [Chitinophagaceae bacterium]
MRCHFIISIVLSALFLTYAAAQKKYVFESAKMGSPFTVTICSDDSLKAAAAAGAAFKKADTLNSILSDYVDSSEINRLSATSGQGRYVKVSPELYNILSIGRQAAVLSQGSFDVTIGPVVKVWRRARKTNIFPSKDSIAAALRCTGYRYMHLDSVHQSVWLEKAGMQLDIGGLGKGYVAQIALDVIRSYGFSSAMVNAGGKIVVGDAPPGTQGWIIGINVPGEKQAIMQQLLLLKNTSVATSGDIYQHLDFDGKRYSHIINPKTGIGLTYSANVTAIAPGGGISDWLSTACSVLSPKKTMALIKHFKGGALLITQWENETITQHQSKNFDNFILK